MPVPDLNDTCRKLVEWAQPLLTKEELIKTQQEVEYFLRPGGEGNKLQNELIEWNKHSAEFAWSSPVWRDLYLASRDSLVINSNVFYYLKSKLDEQECSQAHIAAALISSVYDFIGLIDNQTLSVDMQKTSTLCMSQYKSLFSSIRIPQPDTDKFLVSSSRMHIVLMHNQSMYQLNVLDADGVIRPPEAIEQDLNCILSTSKKGPNLGLLTTLPREVWAKSRANLLEISATNKASMKAVEEAAFVLCLDERLPDEITEISKQLLHGGGKDRFFDKSLQFIVFQNGKTGVNFEHTGVDGSVMLRLIKHIYDTIDEVLFADIDNTEQPKQVASVNIKEIEFDLDDGLTQAISSAADAFCQHTANTQTRVLNFTQFGKNQIKKFGVSPDAFVQLALQMAEHKLYGKCYSAYEAVMTRTFLDGRIDVLYTVSPESMALIHNMGDVNCSRQTKVDSLVKAAQKHIERAGECRSGQGVYTHFLALKYRYNQIGNDIGINTLPKLFSDKGFQKLTHSVVCTSTTSDYGVELAGYGPIVDDGYGIRYFKRDESICFNMTSRTAMRDNLDEMYRNIEESLLEMASLMARKCR